MIGYSGNIDEAIRTYFGFDRFRPGQVEIISSLLSGNDTLAVMPTGGGKSLCYQLPAMICSGVAIVISPLIALMKDQTDALLKLSIPAAFINSTLTSEEINERMYSAERGQLKLLYIAPERLESKNFISLLTRINISFLAIDEAHCVSEWGHDFRPSYLSIPISIPDYNKLIKIALTATATPEVQNDIIDSLKMKKANRFVKGFDRPNLSYHTFKSNHKKDLLINMMQNGFEGSVIIYCATRKKVEQFDSVLNSHGISSSAYHAGLSNDMRKKVQEDFLNNSRRVIVATNAFGMGIDHPNVRKVVHLDLTQTLESYYQEAGRAGRDGLPADCLMIYHPSDRKLQEFFINSTYPDMKVIELVYNTVYDLGGVRAGTLSKDILQVNEILLGNRLNLPSNTVKSALKCLDRYGIISFMRNGGKVNLRIISDRENILSYFERIDWDMKEVLEAILRSVSAEAFNNDVSFNLFAITEMHNIDNEKLLQGLRNLEMSGIIRYNADMQSGGIKFEKERTGFNLLPINWEEYLERRNFAFRKLDIVQRYAETRECKRHFILRYFRESEHSKECGNCSSCLEPLVYNIEPSSKNKYLVKSILNATESLNGRFGARILAELVKGSRSKKLIGYGLDLSEYYASCQEFTITEIDEAIEFLLLEGKLVKTPELYPRIMVSNRVMADVKKFIVSEDSFFVDKELLMNLKKIRESISKRESIPLDLIADLNTLRQLAKYKPTEKDEIIELGNIGVVVNERFADYFIYEIRKSLLKADEAGVAPQTKISDDAVRAYKLLNEGYGINDISKSMKVSSGEIAVYLQEAVNGGYSIEPGRIADIKLYNKVLMMVSKNPNIPLRKLRMSINEEIDFATLRVLAAIARNKEDYSK